MAIFGDKADKDNAVIDKEFKAITDEHDVIIVRTRDQIFATTKSKVDVIYDGYKKIELSTMIILVIKKLKNLGYKLESSNVVVEDNIKDYEYIFMK